jgi:hypothetical protein
MTPVVVYPASDVDVIVGQLKERVRALEARNAAASSGGGFSPWLNARDFGAHPDNPDNLAGLQAAVAAAWENGCRRVFLPVGAYRISRAVDISGVTLEGVGPVSGCALVCTTAGQGCVSILGERNGVHVPGGRLAGMGILIASGLAGGVAVQLGTAGVNLPDRFELAGLRITTAGLPHGTWTRCIVGNGTGRTSPTGFRGGTIRDVEFFNASGPAIVLWGVNGIRMHGVNGYTGGGLQAATGVWIGGTAAVQSTDVQVSDCCWDGPINVTNTLHSGFEGRFWGGVQTDATSQQSCVFSTN